MVVYVEELFINNLCLLLFVQYLTCLLINIKARPVKIILVSLFSSLIYIFSLYIGFWGYLMLIFFPFLIVSLLKNFTHIKDYLTAVFIFVLIYFALIGSSAFIAYLYGMQAVNILYLLGNIPFFISISFILITLFACYIKAKLLTILRLNSNILQVEIINSNYCCRTKAYYDTGNMVCTKNGEWVVIVSDVIYNKLMPAPSQEVKVATIKDEYSLLVTPILIKIYFEDGVNKIYKVMAGKGKIDTDRYKIILHKDMR
ncbi:MAG: hypothetical protein GX242_02885 [Clostridiales bacterium]|nr:hypothetical protein [Clostridiales bacterium]